MDPFREFLRKVLHEAGEIYFQWAEGELGTFAQAFHIWLYDLFKHPTPHWRESFEHFLAQQESERRIVIPESRRAIIEYLESWAASIGLEPAGLQGRAVTTSPGRLAAHSISGRTSNTDGEQTRPRYPEIFGPALSMFEEENRSRAALAMPPLADEPPPVPDHRPRIVEIKQLKGFWAHYDEAVASGQFEPNWFQRGLFALARAIFPESEGSTRITFDDGTVLFLLGGGPDSGALGGQAAFLLGLYGAVAHAATLKQAVFSLFSHLGRETAEAIADNVVQEITKLPLGPSSLRRPKAAGGVNSTGAAPKQVPAKLRRPKLRKKTRQAIEDAATKTEEGKFIDPHTKEVIEGKFHYGHIEGREHRRLMAEAERQGMTQEQFNDWVNSHPEWFQVQTPESNASHRFEKPGRD